MKTVQLRNDVLLPMIGAGMWKITDREQMRDVIRTAYQCGYRLFDSAAVYYNEMVLERRLQNCSCQGMRSFCRTSCGIPAMDMKMRRQPVSTLLKN